MPNSPQPPPPPLPPDTDPTAARREFARVVGRLLADRWRGRHAPPDAHPDQPAASQCPPAG